MTDRDLWEPFHSKALQKGLASIKVFKVKGHTDLHDADGKISHESHLGNTYADHLADLGADLIGVGVHRLATIYGRRQDIYVKYLITIHAHFAMVWKHFNATRERKERIARIAAGEQGRRHVNISPTLPDWPDEDATKLHLEDTHIFEVGPQHTIMSTWVFLTTLKISPTNAREQSTSWLELFALFDAK